MGIAIVSVYPPRGEHHSQMSGVASMAKNIADTVSTDDSVHILANKTDDGAERYVEDGATVHRCWERGPLYPLQIVCALFRIEDVSAVHVHHEYDGMYGGVLMNALFPLLLLGLRLAGPKVVTQPHGVLFDADVVNAQSAGSAIVRVPDAVLELVLLCFNQLLISLSDTLVVPNSALETTARNRCFVGQEGITVIPHGVEPRVADVRDSAPDDPTLLYFGYITWRKGPDVLAEVAGSLPEEWDVVLAGGKVPYLAEDPNYQSYYDDTQELAAQSENVMLTGFVDEDELDTHFREADILLLPYRSFVAASGVFSLGLRYSLPFLLSEEICPVLENDDITEPMTDHGLERSDLTFSIRDAATDLEQQVRALCDSGKYAAASRLAQDVCDARAWEQLRDEYRELYR